MAELSNKPTGVLVITGPTASGKSAVAVKVAKRLNGEIISADSVQIYKCLNVGSAKPTREEMEGIPHHLIDSIEPTERFSVADFRRQAEKCIVEIMSRARLPIVCGGTMLYIRSLMDGYAFPEGGYDPALRQELYRKYAELGLAKLREDLQSIDPVAARKIHPNDVRRAIRALEVYFITGHPISDTWQEAKGLPYPLLTVALDIERHELYSRIEQRVDKMLQAGLAEEVLSLLSQGYSMRLQCFNSVGYAEVIRYLKGECTLEEARRLIIRNTRRLAKRQLTWLRNDDRIVWVYAGKHSQLEEVAERICTIYKNWRAGHEQGSD
ncbi:MAG: tRNA (adenosine(37)-N6)-dimethylallyltransferase MiaA [Bacillota bacterium]